MNNLTLFQFNAHEIRVISIDGEPWFVAKDLCAILDIGNTSQALSRLEDDEKRTIILNEGTNGNPEKSIVSESGMFSLVLSSRKPDAKKFRKWVTSEVLPSIRKTGGYQLRQMSVAEMFLAQAQMMVEVERKQQAMESRLAAIERDRIEAEEALAMLPLCEEAAAAIPTRGKVNLIVRTKAQKDSLAYNHVWAQLYQQLYYRYHYDVKARCRNSGLAPLDQIEKDDMMDKLHAIASEVLA